MWQPVELMLDDVEAVFNYDIPQDDEYYATPVWTNRPGRIRTGIAFSFVVGREVYKLRDIRGTARQRLFLAVPSLDDITEIKAREDSGTGRLCDE